MGRFSTYLRVEIIITVSIVSYAISFTRLQGISYIRSTQSIITSLIIHIT